MNCRLFLGVLEEINPFRISFEIIVLWHKLDDNGNTGKAPTLLPFYRAFSPFKFQLIMMK